MNQVGRRSALALGLGALLLAVLGWAGRAQWREPQPPLAIVSLARAAAGQRLVEGRLCGGFAWAALQPEAVPLAGTADQGAATRGVTQLASGGGRRDILRVAVTIPPNDLHALGVASLLLGNVELAITQLQESSEESPRAEVLSDLAAALIERGRTPDHAQDLVYALDVAERALALEPGLQEAWFNRALAIEVARLREPALTAWQRYLEVDAHSPWAKETRGRLDRLRRPPARRWEADAAAFDRACATGDVRAAETLARAHPQESTEHVLEDLLPTWVDLASKGDVREASAAQGRLRCGADAVGKATHDSLLSRAADEVDAYTPSEQHASFLTGCRSLIAGRRALDALDATHAGQQLEEAVRWLSASGSALRELAEMSKLSSDHYAGTLDEAAAMSLAARASPIIAAKARWLAGLSLSIRGRFTEALPPLQQASRALEQLGFSGDAVFVRSMEASTWRYLGRTSRAWTESVRVFGALDEVPDPRRVQAVLTESAMEAGMEGYARAALTLQEAALQFAARHDSVVDRCDAQVWLARAAARVGEDARALRALEIAEVMLPRISDSAVRERMGAEAHLIRAGLLVEGDPTRAADHAGLAMATFRHLDVVPSVVEALAIRARAGEVQGDIVQAEQDYVAALQAVESQRSFMDDPALKMSFFDTQFDLARNLVRFEWAQGHPEKALLWADQLRSRTLRESRSDQSNDRLSEIRRRLRPEEAILFYACLPERTIVWVLRKDGIRSEALPWSEARLDERVRAWRTALIEGNDAASIGEAAELFAMLVKPVAPSLVDAQRVTVVPDGVLNLVSWASLRDPERGGFWIRRTAIAVAPCLSAVGTGSAIANGSVVAVGDPTFDRSLFPDLPELTEAARESAEVASFYPRAQVLTGDKATPSRVLLAAEHADVVHIAAHGLADGVDPERSLLALAPEQGGTSHGLLFPKDIRIRRLQGVRLVVLAACRSGDGPLSRSEGALSLARPFLQAGARAVLVSLVDLPDAPSPASLIHRHLNEGEELVEAFRRAVLECWGVPSADVRSCGGLQLIVNRGEG